MQKKLIALAITAAFASAPAFADTSVYGLIDAGYGNVTNTPQPNGTKTGQSGVDFSANQTSRVGVKSTEDLGNGMKAIYQLEMGLSSNPAADAGFGKAAVVGGTAATTTASTASGFTPNASISPDRILTAGLDFGQGTSVTVGKMSSPLRNIAYGNDAMYGSNLVGNLVTMDASLTARSIQAVAAQNFGAVTASLGLLDNTYTSDGVADTKNDNGFELAAIYNQDALSVSGAYRNTKNNATPGSNAPVAVETTTKDLIVAANYNFGVAKLYGQFAQVKADAATSTKRTYETVGVNVPFTPTLAGYVELSSGKHDLAASSNNMSGYNVGAKYDLSKTSWLYASVGSAKEDNTSKVDEIALGMVHSF